MKEYFKRFKKIYKISNIIQESILIGLVIMLIDRLNLLTFCISNNYLFVLIFLVLFFIVKYFNKLNYKKIYAKNITELDRYIYAYFFLLIVLCIYIIFFDYKLYKIILLVSSLIIYCFLVIKRIKHININLRRRYNILKLKDICSNEIELDKYKGLVLVEESEADYDLLNRGFVINQLYNVIIKSYSRGSFTIGLNGKWGCGKTTIINNVIAKIYDNKQIDMFDIIRFNPWLYNDEKSMLEAFLSQIINKTNYDMSCNGDRESIDEIMNLIFGSNCKSVLNFICNNIKRKKTTELKNTELVNIVNDYLKHNNKKLLIIIDNLDRIDGDRALFLIRCLDSVLKFENTINVLLYDEKIINDILNIKYHFNEKYMEKLVHLKIDVPIANKYTINNIKNKVSNNLLYEGKNIIDFESNYLYEFNNLRELKRYINLMISFTSCSNNELNSKDSAMIKYIQLACPDLFYEIWNNKNYFILYDRQYDEEIYTLDYENLNKDAKNYFRNLYSDNKLKKYLCYAEFLFPNMIKGREGDDDIFTFDVNSSDYSDSILNNRISNTKYFDLYFTGESNDFTKIRKDVDRFIKLINNDSNNYNAIATIIRKYNVDEVKVLIETLYLRINNDDIKSNYKFIRYLMRLQTYMTDRPLFGELDSKSRSCAIIAKLFVNIMKEEYLNFYNNIISDYKSLGLLDSIKYWINAFKKKNMVYQFDVDDLYNEMCSSILNNNIDIYSPNNYCRKGIWALYRYNQEDAKKYMKKNINQNNIYLFLSDIISVSFGSDNYRYSISDDSINCFLTKNVINNLLNQNTKLLSKKEAFIKIVYYESVNEKDQFEKGVNTDKYVKL